MHDSVRKLALQIYKNTHRVASTPELVTKKYQVNKEDDDVDMSTVGNRLIWRYCVVSEIGTNFRVFSTYFSLKFLFRNF